MQQTVIEIHALLQISLCAFAETTVQVRVTSLMDWEPGRLDKS